MTSPGTMSHVSEAPSPGGMPLPEPSDARPAPPPDAWAAALAVLPLARAEGVGRVRFLHSNTSPELTPLACICAGSTAPHCANAEIGLQRQPQCAHRRPVIQGLSVQYKLLFSVRESCLCMWSVVPRT